MNHPIIKHLILPNEMKNEILNYVYYNIWRGKLNKLICEYKKVCRITCCDKFVMRSYMNEKVGPLINDQDPELRVKVYGITNIGCFIRANVSPNYAHLKLYLN